MSDLIKKPPLILNDPFQRAATPESLGDSELAKQLGGYSLTTAEILYRMPDHPSLLQTYIWQEFDLHPRFPNLCGFLDFWQANLEGPLHKVTVAHRELVSPAEVKILAAGYKLGMN